MLRCSHKQDIYSHQADRFVFLITLVIWALKYEVLLSCKIPNNEESIAIVGYRLRSSNHISIVVPLPSKMLGISFSI